MSQYEPTAPPADSPETVSGRNDDGAMNVGTTIHENQVLVNGGTISNAFETTGGAQSITPLRAEANSDRETFCDMLREAVAATFSNMVSVAQSHVDDERLARAVARGAVTFLEKQVVAGLRFSSPEHAGLLLRDVTRAGCGYAIVQRALLMDELAASHRVIETRRTELCLLVHQDSLSVPGRAHIESIKERVAEVAVRGTLPVFTSDEDRFRYLAAISRNLRHEGARLDFGRARGRKPGTGGNSSPAVAEDIADSTFAVTGRLDERLDAARAVRLVQERFPDLIAYASRDHEGAEAVPVRERVQVFRRRRAAEGLLTAKGFVTP